MPMVEQTVSGRTLQQFAPAPDNQTSVRDTDGDYTMEDDMFNLPTDGTDGRVVRGTRCGSQATMGCGNGTAPSPDASLLGINLEGTIAIQCFVLVNCTGRQPAAQAKGLRTLTSGPTCRALPSNCAQATS